LRSPAPPGGVAVDRPSDAAKAELSRTLLEETSVEAKAGRAYLHISAKVQNIPLPGAISSFFRATAYSRFAPLGKIFSTGWLPRRVRIFRVLAHDVLALDKNLTLLEKGKSLGLYLESST